MSLDKFLSGNKPKKKKKSSKSLLKENNRSETTQADVSQTKSPELSKSSADENTTHNTHSTPEKDNNQKSEISNHESTAINDTSDQIFVPEFKNKTKNDLFEIILDLIHTSPTYSRNKNLIASYLADNNNNKIIPELLADQLEISVNEVLVLLSEIKNELS